MLKRDISECADWMFEWREGDKSGKWTVK